MGYFFASGTKDKLVTPNSLWKRLECRACPLNVSDIRSPKMQPTGSDNPVIYILGEAPGKLEDQRGEQFVGASGNLLRPLIPKQYKNKIRWNNTIRCWPGIGNPDPQIIHTECCRPSIVRDIEATKPKAIFGFGNYALSWALDRTTVSNWRGRRIPIKIGSHKTWFYPFMHPSFILHGKKSDNYKTPDEKTLILDLNKAFSEIESLPEPIIYDVAFAKKDITCVDGSRISDLNIVLEFLEWASNQPCIGLDYETNGLRPYIKNSKILTISLSDGIKTLAFSLYHRQSRWTSEQIGIIEKAYVKFLRSPVIKTVHNLMFEQEWTGVKFGIDLLRSGGRWEDSASQAYILDERSRGKGKNNPLSLDFLVLQHFGLNLKFISQLDRVNLDNEPLRDVLLYNGMDAKFHKLLFDVQAQLIEQQGLVNQYNMMVRRVPTVALTQIKGIPISQKENIKLATIYNEQLNEIQEKLDSCDDAKTFAKVKGEKFNPLSSQHVIYYLSNILKTRDGQKDIDYKYLRTHPNKTKDDVRWSGDKEVLSVVGTELCKLVLKYRAITKLKGTYVDSVSATSEESNLFPDGLLHPTFTTIFTTTGRLSCYDPNMQNWPSRDQGKKEVKKQIRAPKGMLFFSLDLGQIEARVIAMASADPIYCKALWENYNIHSEWTYKIAKACSYWVQETSLEFKTDEKVFKKYRDITKNKWTFPLFFGATLSTVAGYLNVNEEDLKPIYEEWWKTFEASKNWQDNLLKNCDEKGYVETLTGRRRHMPLSINKILNSPIQGTACDLILDVMDRLSEMDDPYLQPILQIHDDLSFLFPEDQIDKYAEIAISQMLLPTFDFINVPISVEAFVGKTWADKSDIGVYDSYQWHKLPVQESRIAA